VAPRLIRQLTVLSQAGLFYREKDTAKPARRGARDTIPHSQQRYSTVGDWQIDKAGKLVADIVADDLTLVDPTRFRSTRFTLGS
jgi:hypothetical protein